MMHRGLRSIYSMVKDELHFLQDFEYVEPKACTLKLRMTLCIVVST